MKRKLVIGCGVLLLLGFTLRSLWIVLDWPPPHLILEYGFPPTGGRTGETCVIEGIEFIELEPGYFRQGTHRFCEPGDLLGRVANTFGLSWGLQPLHRGSCCPPRWIEIPRGFWIAKTEATVFAWERYLSESNAPSAARWKEPSQLPIDSITRAQAREFCRWLSGRHGVQARLPLEKEWEFACRAGAKSFYHFGDDEGRLSEYAWFSEDSSGQKQPVATKRPNAWGLHDMHGNVWEWCGDEPPASPEWSLASPVPTVHRGGGSNNPAVNQWCGTRIFWARDMPDRFLGFRPVISLPD